ncbi:hypothetical protein CR513_03863, partial [Mucuna pruriens]
MKSFWPDELLSKPTPSLVDRLHSSKFVLIQTKPPFFTLLLLSRSSSNKLHAFDLEIDRTLYSSVDTNSNSNIADNTSHGADKMENNDRTLKELATPDVMYQPWCIQYLQLEQAQSYELKFGLIHLLPKFHGLVSEDPHKHLKEFHMLCSTMRLYGIPKDYIKMKAFSFSLDGAAKDWLYLQPVLFNT